MTKKLVNIIMHVPSCFKVPDAVPGVRGRDEKLFLNEHRVSVPIKVVQMDGGDACTTLVSVNVLIITELLT